MSNRRKLILAGVAAIVVAAMMGVYHAYCWQPKPAATEEQLAEAVELGRKLNAPTSEVANSEVRAEDLAVFLAKLESLPPARDLDSALPVCQEIWRFMHGSEGRKLASSDRDLLRHQFYLHAFRGDRQLAEWAMSDIGFPLGYSMTSNTNPLYTELSQQQRWEILAVRQSLQRLLFARGAYFYAR